MVQLSPQAQTVLSDRPVSHKALANMLTRTHPPTVVAAVMQGSLYSAVMLHYILYSFTSQGLNANSPRCSDTHARTPTCV